MTAQDFFQLFWAEVRKTPHWQQMERTVEGSEWHREANVAVHTTMCIEHYLMATAPVRSEREQLLTLITLLFHDFGKPEAEETVEAKDGSGRTYHRYAGHEPKSANEFYSFICEHADLREQLFAQGLSWTDLRKIKWMIEHHLPFGLKNETKRSNLKLAMELTLGKDKRCFYDQLWSDCNGRISDNHDVKRQAVVDWIAEFEKVQPSKVKAPAETAPICYLLVGPVGVGKSTWTAGLRKLNRGRKIHVVSEDEYRMEWFGRHATNEELGADFGTPSVDLKSRYDRAWRFCHMNPDVSMVKGYEAFVKEETRRMFATGETVVVDRTNQTRKSRGPFVAAAKAAGYHVMSVEFVCSEKVSLERQATREDKAVPPNRVHQIYMAFETPWLGYEVDDFEIVPT